VTGELEMAEERLADAWVKPLLSPGDRVSFGSPLVAAAGEGREVVLHLLDLTPSPPPRGPSAPALQLVARYLVFVREGDGTDGRSLLAELAFAALATPRLEIDRTPLPLDFWRGAGIAPRPSLVVRVPVPRLPPSRPAPLVRAPLETTWSGLHPLEGVIVAGAEDTPVAGALVELQGQGLSTYSDRQGGFRFSAVPAVPRTKTLVVRAKGQELAVSAAHPAEPPERLTIRLPLPEA
jgi:hypothetical protein